MKCKFCNAEMEDGQTVCPVCGADNQEQTEEKAETMETAGEETIETAQPAENVREETPDAAEDDAAETPCEMTDEKSDEEEASAEVTEKKKPSVLKIILSVAGGLVIAGILVCALLYGLGQTGSNTIFYRDCYTMNAQKAEKTSDKVVATVGDKKLTNGELQVYYQMNVVNFVNHYGAYVNALGLDPSKPLNEQVQDPETNTTWEQFFLENSIETWQRYAALGMLAQQDEFKLDEDTEKQLDELETQLGEAAKQGGFSSVQEMVASEMGPSATAEGYLSYMRTYYESLAYYDQIFDTLQPTDEEVDAYFEANKAKYEESGLTKDTGDYADVRHILLKPEEATQDESGNLVASDEQWAACETKAEEILDQWKEGDATEEAFSQLAAKYSTDMGSAQRGGLIDHMMQGQTVEEFDKWSFDEARQYGDTGIVKSKFGIHIIYFVSREPIWQTVAHNDVITENTDKMLQDAMEKWPMDIKYRKIVLSRVGGDEEPAATTVPESSVPAENTAAPETVATETAEAK